MNQDSIQPINELKNILGSEHITYDDKVLNEYETATFKTKRKITAIARPKNTDEVQQCIKTANKYKLPVYPISTGLNTGYGSKVPTADGCIIIELKRLNRIIDFNEDLAYVTIEPGVTQQQLYDYLQEKNQTYGWM